MTRHVELQDLPADEVRTEFVTRVLPRAAPTEAVVVGSGAPSPRDPSRSDGVALLGPWGAWHGL